MLQIPMISIIIPIYNAEKYISTCLGSILSQTLYNIEIICVNDGSTDNSLEILEEYQKKDSRIVILNQENQGVSVARNYGISKATAEYIMFMDADDTIKKITCEKLYNYINNTDIDIVQFQHVNIVLNNKFKLFPYKKSIKKAYNVLSNLKISFPKNDYIFCWDRLYRKNFIENNGIKFPLGQKFAEDFIFVALLYSKNPKQLIVEDYLYNHVINSDSVCGSTKPYSKFDSIKNLNILLYEQLFDKNIDLYYYSLNLLLYNLLGLWHSLYFSKYKEEYIEKVLEIFKSIDDNKKFASLSTTKKYLLIEKFKLSKIYWFLIHPIEKYFYKFL